jgi:DNA-binding transcriptional MerR regulator
MSLSVMSTDLVRQAGVSLRQLDHWTSQGYVRPDPRVRETSGCPRYYSGQEPEVTMTMARLIVAGFTASRAASLARLFVEDGVSAVTLGGGMRLSLTSASTDVRIDT